MTVYSRFEEGFFKFQAVRLRVILTRLPAQGCVMMYHWYSAYPQPEVCSCVRRFAMPCLPACQVGITRFTSVPAMPMAYMLAVRWCHAQMIK